MQQRKKRVYRKKDKAVSGNSNISILENANGKLSGNNQKECAYNQMEYQAENKAMTMPDGNQLNTRVKVEKDFLVDLHDCWARRGKAAMLKAFDTKPAEMVQMVARLLPKRAEVQIEASLQLPDEQRKRIAEAWLLGENSLTLDAVSTAIEGEIVHTVQEVTDVENEDKKETGEPIDEPPARVMPAEKKRRLVSPRRSITLWTEDE